MTGVMQVIQQRPLRLHLPLEDLSLISIRQHLSTCLIAIVLFSITSTGHARDPDYRSPKQAEGATTVSVDEAKWMFDDGAIFIDVRNTRFFDRRHVPGAIHLDKKGVYSEETLAAVASKDDVIVIYSSGVRCGRAHRAAEQAASWGYKKIYYYRGGIVDWKDVGYPMESSPIRP